MLIPVNVAEFMEKAKKEIATFYGIKYTSGDLEKGVACLKHGQVFLGSDIVLAGALALGFTSTIMTTLNICPELSIKVAEFLKNGKVKEAREYQYKLNDEIADILSESMKGKFYITI